MKKIQRLVTIGLLVVWLAVACLTGCDARGEHTHTGKWVCDEDTHSWQYTCGCSACFSDVLYEAHVDNDGDRSCDVCRCVIEGLILPTVTKQVPEETFSYACEKYDLVFNHTHYVIENDGEYRAFLSDIGESYVGISKPTFADSVIFCHARCISGSWDFLQMQYAYYPTRNKIIGKHTHQFAPDVNFPDVVLGYCIDLVEVPKNVFEALQNNVV